MSGAMELAARTRLWLRALFHRRGADHELDREMQFHIDMEIEQLIRGGMSLREARRTAMISFGGVERHKESVRDERGTRIIDELAGDVRQSVRAFRARPGFTATAAITMAIGIAASTSVFSVVNWILVRPVPGVRAPHELVRIDLHHASGDSAMPTISPAGISYPNFVQLSRETSTLQGMAAGEWENVQFAAMTAPAAELHASVIVGDYFGLLGVQPEAGRFFDAAERDPHAALLVAVISDSVWRAAFDASPSAIGRAVRVNGAAFTVLGVAPRGFRGIDRIGDVNIWLTAASMPTLYHSARMDVNDQTLGAFMDLFGRLKSGATPAAAQDQLRAVLKGMLDANPATNGILKDHLAHVTPDLGLVGMRRQWASGTLRLLAIVAAIVMLVSCANAANLLLLRGVRRRSELAVRRALGATFGRLIRQQIVEGLLLATLGGVAGIVLTVVFRAVMRDQQVPGFPPMAGVPIDWRVVAFAFALSLAGGIVFATIPALLSLRTDFLDALKNSGVSDGSGLRIRRALAIVQIAACTTLVVGGALLGRTLRALHAVDAGFDVEHTSAYTIEPTPQGYDREHIRRFRAALSESMRAIPGVDAVSFASQTPLGGGTALTDLRSGSSVGTDWPDTAATVWADPGYFSALQIPILLGDARSIGVDADSLAPDRVVISRSLAAALFGGENPIGRTIVARKYRGMITHIVVGVAADIHATSLRREPDRSLYEPFARYPLPFSVVLVRSSRPRLEIERAVGEAVAKIDPSVPVGVTRVMSEIVERSIAQERLFARVVTLLALLAAALTAAGIYGIIAHSVAERTREIGVRVALGATTAAVVSLMTRQVALMVAAGLTIGAIGSFWLSRLLVKQLFGVTPLDPASYAIAGVFLLVLGVIASVAPARTAASINPVDALRHE